MPLYSFEGLAPQVHPSAFIAPTATLVGDVIVEEGASIWYGAVIRADYAPVIVRAGANVQDNATLHGPPGLTTDIGYGATVAHNCVVHGATIGDEALIANGAVVLDAARIGSRTLVAAGSVVAAEAEFADNLLVVGAPAVVKRVLAGSPAEFWVDSNPGAYAELAQRHRGGIREI